MQVKALVVSFDAIVEVQLHSRKGWFFPCRLKAEYLGVFCRTEHKIRNYKKTRLANEKIRVSMN